MNDKLIINSISKIYFSIISFFIFIFLTFSITFLFLSKGIYLKEITLSTFHINKLYIKWDEKLNISIDKLTIFTKENSPPVNLEVKNIRKQLKSFGLGASFIQSLIIQTINYRDIKATLRYLDKSGGYIRASSDNFNINTIVYTSKQYINFEILDFKDSIKKIHAKGNVVLDLRNRELLLNAKVDISSDISLSIYTLIDAKKLQYAFVSEKKITSIDHLISILDLSKTMKYWVYDAIKMKNIQLTKAHGFIDFDKPKEAFKNLYISADIEKMEYKYNLALDSIHTQTTHLEFSKGVLNIVPKNHTTYDFFLDTSWLKIDFSKEEYELILYLVFEGAVDKNLLYLLNTFDIKLPFKQNTGVLKTDLTLNINLITLDVDAKGFFDTDNSNFTYLGLDLDIFKTHVELNNFNVDITKMHAKYNDNVSADVIAKLDVKHNIGTINFDIKKANFIDDALILDENKSLHITYNISNGDDSINLSKSFWKLYDSEHVVIEKIQIPFNYENLFASIPTTQIDIENIATIYLSGSMSFKNFNTNIEFDLAKFNYQNISLNQSNLLFDLSFSDSTLRISSNDIAKFTIDNYDISLLKPNVSFYKNILVANSSALKMDNFFESEVAFNYSTQFSNGFLNLKNLKFKNDALGDIFNDSRSIGLRIKMTPQELTAECSDFDIFIRDQKDKWTVSFNSLALLNKHSSLLQKYNIDDGKVSIFKLKEKKNIKFLASIKHKEAFLSIDNKLINNYIIDGYIDQKQNDVHLKINNRVEVTIADNVTIKGKDIGVNLGASLSFLTAIKDPPNNTETKEISVELKNSFIYFSPNRKAIANKISLQYYDDIISAQLTYKGADAGFKLQDDLFYLYGEGFNDEFMENLFALSKFKDGTFDFSVKGTLDEFSGILYIKDTTIMEYKLLNNVLAFINTIPSLVTFSLPGYNQKGLNVKNSYVNFSHKNSLYTLKDIYLNSKEMEILGKGTASYEYNTVDLKLNLKTDLGSTASKIPVVGYIIFDEDSISTSLKVSGALDNPNVESMLATDIIIAPLNIIKRTLLFPFKIFESND